ncbi:MAG: preprotein translocase subunit YajC [Actinomycetes bacterium]
MAVSSADSLSPAVLAAADPEGRPLVDSAALGQLLPLLLLVVLFWFLIIRPQRNRQRETQRIQASLRPGQQVMTTAGLFAMVSGVEDDVVRLEIAPGVTCRYSRAAVAKIVDDPNADLETDVDTDADKG